MSVTEAPKHEEPKPAAVPVAARAGHEAAAGHHPSKPAEPPKVMGSIEHMARQKSEAPRHDAATGPADEEEAPEPPPEPPAKPSRGGFAEAARLRMEAKKRAGAGTPGKPGSKPDDKT